MFSKLFIVLTAVVVAVSAQGTTAPGASPAAPSLDACTLQCLTLAATQDGCVSFSNLTCACTNPQFQADAGACLAANCGAADVQNALTLQSLECSGLGLSATGPSATPRPVPFTSVASGASVAGGTGVTGGTSAAGRSSAPTNGASTASSPASPTTSAASSSTTSSAAGSLVANGGVAAFMALIAGFLAL